MAKVLIADDEEYVRFFLRTILEPLSFDIVGEVENGNDLLSTMESTLPDILLLDINMPNLTGVEFLQKYGHKFHKTCVIILTSVSLMSLVGEKSISGVQCFLSKNTPVKDMISAIEQTWEEFKKQQA